MSRISAATAVHEAALDLEPRFSAVYAEHVDYVWTNLRRLGLSGSDLEDAVQETFLVVFRRWDDFRPDGAWHPWLFGIARRVAARHRRGVGRRLRLLGAVDDRPDAPEGPDEQASRQHAMGLLERFLGRLPVGQREVFILADLEGRTAVEIGQALDISPNTVGSRLRAARAAFERWVDVLAARERGAQDRVDRAQVLRLGREDRAPESARQRVGAALAGHLAMPSGTTALWLAIKPVLIAVAIAIGGVASITVVARTTRSPVHVRNDVERKDGEREPAGPVARAQAATTATATATATPPEATTPASLTSVLPNAAAPSVLPATSAPRPAAGSRAAPAPREIPDPMPSEPAAATSSTLAAEAELVQRARTALRQGDASTALAHCDDHARRFDTGVLARERVAIAIAAQCRLGRTAAASDAARAWAGAHASAPLPRDVRDGCAGAEKTSTPPAGPGQ